MEYLKSALGESMAMIPVTLIVVAMILRQIPIIKTWHIIIALWVFAIFSGVVFEEESDFLQAIVHGVVNGSIATGLALFYARFLVTKEEKEPHPPNEQ
jgi:hypothetical protein